MVVVALAVAVGHKNAFGVVNRIVDYMHVVDAAVQTHRQGMHFAGGRRPMRLQMLLALELMYTHCCHVGQMSLN